MTVGWLLVLLILFCCCLHATCSSSLCVALCSLRLSISLCITSSMIRRFLWLVALLTSLLLKACDHCASAVTPRWRDGPEGEDWCDACWQFHQKHNRCVRRPFGMHLHRVLGCNRVQHTRSLHPVYLSTHMPQSAEDPFSVQAAQAVDERSIAQASGPGRQEGQNAKDQRQVQAHIIYPPIFLLVRCRSTGRNRRVG